MDRQAAIDFFRSLLVPSTQEQRQSLVNVGINSKNWVVEACGDQCEITCVPNPKIIIHKATINIDFRLTQEEYLQLRNDYCKDLEIAVPLPTELMPQFYYEFALINTKTGMSRTVGIHPTNTALDKASNSVAINHGHFQIQLTAEKKILIINQDPGIPVVDNYMMELQPTDAESLAVAILLFTLQNNLQIPI